MPTTTPLPLPSRTRAVRIGLHGVFGGAILASALFVARLVHEPHLALGFDADRDGVVTHVVSGSAASLGGLEAGDRLRFEERGRYQAWLEAPSRPLVLHPIRGTVGREVQLAPPPEVGLGDRLRAVHPTRWVLLGVGLVAFLIGWVVVRLSPTAPGVGPFALWSASTLLLFTAPTFSAAWSAGMDDLAAGWRLTSEALFQSAALHWLLLFPRRLASDRQVALVYVAVGGAAAAGALLAATSDPTALFLGPFVALSNGKAAAVGLAVLGLIGVQFARASSRKAAQQAGWVLLAIAAYSVVDLGVWTLPDVLGYRVPLSAPALDAVAAVAYLVIPAGIAVATTQERLFRVDRFVLRGITYALALGALSALYVAAAAGVAVLLDGRVGTALPVGWGVLLALTAALALRPLLGRAERVVGHVFDRRRRQHRAALARFEEASDHALVRCDLERALGAAVEEGLSATCRVVYAAQPAMAERPGNGGLNEEAGRVLLNGEAPAYTPLRVPLRTKRHAFGTACVGPLPGGQPFTDDDLAFLRALARQFAGAAERILLREEVAARELDAARTRLRIAADLHDDVGAGLSSIALLADLAGAADGARADRLGAIGRAAREMVDTMRDIVWSIDPVSERPGALNGRLRDVAAGLLGPLPHTLDLPEPDALDGLDMDERRHLLLLTKEALHNVARHAHAAHVEVRLEAADGQLALTVRDDGVGFHPEAVRGGTGLRSMRERARRLGGTLSVESTPGAGTTVRVLAERRERVGRRAPARA